MFVMVREPGFLLVYGPPILDARFTANGGAHSAVTGDIPGLFSMQSFNGVLGVGAPNHKSRTVNVNIGSGQVLNNPVLVLLDRVSLPAPTVPWHWISMDQLVNGAVLPDGDVIKLQSKKLGSGGFAVEMHSDVNWWKRIELWSGQGTWNTPWRLAAAGETIDEKRDAKLTDKWIDLLNEIRMWKAKVLGVHECVYGIHGGLEAGFQHTFIWQKDR